MKREPTVYIQEFIDRLPRDTVLEVEVDDPIKTDFYKPATYRVTHNGKDLWRTYRPQMFESELFIEHMLEVDDLFKNGIKGWNVTELHWEHAIDYLSSPIKLLDLENKKKFVGVMISLEKDSFVTKPHKYCGWVWDFSPRGSLEKLVDWKELDREYKDYKADRER